VCTKKKKKKKMAGPKSDLQQCSAFLHKLRFHVEHSLLWEATPQFLHLHWVHTHKLSPKGATERFTTRQKRRKKKKEKKEKKKNKPVYVRRRRQNSASNMTFHWVLG